MLCGKAAAAAAARLGGAATTVIQSRVLSGFPTAPRYSQPATHVTDSCPWCSAPRDPGPTCPRCGAIYAKAEAIKAHGRAASAANEMPADVETVDAAGFVPADEHDDEWRAVSDPAYELKCCIAAIPVMLLIAMLFHASGLGASLQRIFLTMPVHELGHAVTAWFCGFSAIPTLWKTLIPEERGFVVPLALFAGLAFMIVRAHATSQAALMYAGIALVLLQLIGTFGIKHETTQVLIAFGGDGAGMIIATLLMGSFFFGKRTQLYKGSVRWGLVAIGAASFVDIFATWVSARKDDQNVPYGTTGDMASDAMLLVDNHGWSMSLLISRYFWLGVCCLLALALVYAWGVWRAHAEVESREALQKKREWERRRQEAR